MANNRLYIVDTSTNEYLMLAKGWGCAWSNLWNSDLLNEFLETRFNDGDQSTNLIVGTENDEAFYNEFIVNGIKYNE